jgi:hypothetical protein
MRVTTLSVGLEMRRSNGDYGSDKAEVQLTAALDDGTNVEMALRMLLDLGRVAVEADLKRSPSLAVRRALITEYRTCNRCGERLDDAERGYLHPACKEAEDAEREARLAEREARHQELKRQREEQERAWDDDDANAEERGLVGVMTAGDDEEDVAL